MIFAHIHYNSHLELRAILLLLAFFAIKICAPKACPAFGVHFNLRGVLFLTGAMTERGLAWFHIANPIRSSLFRFIFWFCNNAVRTKLTR